MDTDFLEPATRAVLAMTAALLLHHSEDFSQKLQRKFSKSTNLFSKQPNLLAVPKFPDIPDQLEQQADSDGSECTLSDASSVEALGPAIVVSPPEEQTLPYEDYGLPPYEGTPQRPSLTESLHGGYGPVPTIVVPAVLEQASPRPIDTPVRPPLRDVYHGSYVGSPAPAYQYVYAPPMPELDESYGEDHSFQLGRRAVPIRTQVLRDAPLSTSYIAQAPFIRTPLEAVSRTPQKRVLQRQVASESPGFLSSTVQRGATPQSRFFPSEPSPILASPRSPRPGAMLVRTPQGIRVMTPQEEQSFRLARVPAERARFIRGSQATPQSPRVSPYRVPASAYVTAQSIQPESPESIQMARAAQRYHVRNRIARRPPATPTTSRQAPYTIPDSAKAEQSFRIARPASTYRRPQSLMDSSLPSFAGFPMSEARRGQDYSSAIASTPVSRRGINFPNLSQLPPTPINVTVPSPSSPSTPQRRVPIPAGSPYARPRPQINLSYIAPTPAFRTPSHVRSPIRPPGWDASTARHLMTSAVADNTPPAAAAATPTAKEENLDDQPEISFAPDMNSTMADGTIQTGQQQQQEQGDDIRDALWTLYSKINRQVAIIQAGDRPQEQERIGIFRRSSADYDAEEGRMRE